MSEWTRQREQQLEARLAVATPGPWGWGDPGGVVWCDAFAGRTVAECPGCEAPGRPASAQSVFDAALIAEARQDLEDMLGEIKRLRGEVRRLRAGLAVVDVDVVDIVFDGPPGPEGPRFVEAERDGRSVRIGEWVDRGDGTWALRIRSEVRGG